MARIIAKSQGSATGTGPVASNLFSNQPPNRCKLRHIAILHLAYSLSKNYSLRSTTPFHKSHFINQNTARAAEYTWLLAIHDVLAVHLPLPKPT